MKILSIDTSSKICAVSVLEDTNLLKECKLDNGLTHSETLMPVIQNLLSELEIELNDIDLIVCDKGPGSFTGIRIGVATAMAFSDSLNKKAIGVSSLEALAYNVKNNGIICSLIDAKNDNVYVGVFEKIDEKYLLRRNFTAENIYDVLNEFKNAQYKITFVGDGALTHKNVIMQSFPNCEFLQDNDLSSYNLGLAGLSHFKENGLNDLLPLYLRKPQAERMLEKKEE